MILEGLVTTLDADGAPHLAPMGPRFEPGADRFTLHPFPTSRTYGNLVRTRQGVLHVTDDVLLIARAAVGRISSLPAFRPAVHIDGAVLTHACRAHEFVVDAIDTSQPRVRLEARVVKTHRGPDFYGFNRAKHAVVEAAILMTRLHLLPPAEVRAELERLRPWVTKTGGLREAEAFAFLEEYLNENGGS